MSEVRERVRSRALGDGLRRAREESGMSRGQLVSRLPSGIGERTLLSYEHGGRQLTVVRFLEVCDGIPVSPVRLLAAALQRARIDLANLDLVVDLRWLLTDTSPAFRPMHQWAQNKLNDCSTGIVRVSPAGVRELASFVGYRPEELARYLARFLPDEVPEIELDNGRVGGSVSTVR